MQNIEQIVAALLCEQKKTISVAESCTGGLLASYLTDVPGSSQYFLGGIVAYSNTLKRHLLAVSADTLERYGAVSMLCAREMATGVRKATGSDIALATTGIAGPSGGTAWKPVGLVYIGYADAHACLAQEFIFSESRDRHKRCTVLAALTLLYQRLMPEQTT